MRRRQGGQKAQSQHHKRFFAAADIVTATGHAYTKSALFRRNLYLVDNADLLLTAYDGQPGGMVMTVAYAQQHGILVRCIRPAGKSDASVA